MKYKDTDHIKEPILQELIEKLYIKIEISFFVYKPKQAMCIKMQNGRKNV